MRDEVIVVNIAKLTELLRREPRNPRWLKRAVISTKLIWEDVEGNPIARGQTLDAASRKLSAAHKNAGSVGVDPHNAMTTAIKVIGNDPAGLHWLTGAHAHR
jgi:hypothetical protein